jgi:hypothetical protein
MEVRQAETDLSGTATLTWPDHTLELDLSGWSDSSGRVELVLRDPAEDNSLLFAARLKSDGALEGNFDEAFSNPTPLVLLRQGP